MEGSIKAAAVIGLGLIGGSIAKALRQKGNAISIIGVDINADYVQAALKENTLTSGIVWDGASPIDLSEADVVFLCTPISAIVDTAIRIAPGTKKGCIMTDTGSVKAPIMRDIIANLKSDITFIGGHPMAGTERSGYFAGSGKLLENAYYVLTPPDRCPEEQLHTILTLIRIIGAIPVIMEAEVHDRAVAAISHFPHVLSAGLLHLIEAEEHSQYMKMLAAGAFRDITRIASSNPIMWKDICKANAPLVADYIDKFIEILAAFKDSLIKNDSDGILSYFDNAKKWRENIPIVMRSATYPVFEIVMDVEDQPGIIGQIATLLGQHNINIKNIGIMHSREEEPGVLKIAFDSRDAQYKAAEILQRHGFAAFIDS